MCHRRCTPCTEKHGATEGQEEGRDKVSQGFFHTCQLTFSFIDRRDDQDVYKSAARWISRGITLYDDLHDVFRVGMRIQLGHAGISNSDDETDSGISTHDLRV